MVVLDKRGCYRAKQKVGFYFTKVSVFEKWLYLGKSGIREKWLYVVFGKKWSLYSGKVGKVVVL